MSGPADAAINGDGFRFYRWTDAATGEETDVLSVTSIRKLCGEQYTLVNWQLANLADAALGTMKRTVIGPRGGVSEKRQVWEYPSEFAVQYAEAEGQQSKIDELRTWLRSRAEEPRDIAAIRGTMVHEAIERNIQWQRIERPYVEAEFAKLSGRDKKKARKGVQDDDVLFIRNAVRQYWSLRTELPFIILGRELQVWNLTAGYAGSFDALIWLLGDFVDGVFIPLPEAALTEARALHASAITAEDIKRIGGLLVLADWKTSAGVYTDQVVQAVAYLSAEFVGKGGIKDYRLTGLLQAAMFGGLAHIRPNGWAFHLFEWHAEIARAFLGSVAFARFLAKYPKPEVLFIGELKGESSEEE